MTNIVRRAGLERESLNKALSPAGNREFTPILEVISALGLHLHAVPADTCF